MVHRRAAAPVPARRGGYRRRAGEMLARFGNAPSTRPAGPDDDLEREVAERTAKVCLLSPMPVGDPALLTKLAERAAAPGGNPVEGPWFQLTLGLARYRSGDPAGAGACLTEAEPRLAGPSRATAQMLLAMAYERLGRMAEARDAMDRCRETVRTKVAVAGSDGVLEGGVENWLVCQ